MILIMVSPYYGIRLWTWGIRKQSIKLFNNTSILLNIVHNTNYTQNNHVNIMVKAVRDLVSELCRITLLWDEMWLAALIQRQGEVHRRLLQIEAETKRTFAIHNHVLSMECKEAVMRQKYIATMKPVSALHLLIISVFYF